MKVLIGNADVIGVLEQALAEARKGELIGVVICGLHEKPDDTPGLGRYGWAGAVRDDVAYPFPRLLTTVANAQAELLAHGIGDWFE